MFGTKQLINFRENKNELYEIQDRENLKVHLLRFWLVDSLDKDVLVFE